MKKTKQPKAAATTFVAGDAGLLRRGACSYWEQFSHWFALILLALFPLIAVSIAAMLGMRGVELACMLLAFGSPTAVNSAVMAQQMGSDGDLATEAVVFTTAFSALTMFLFVFALKTLGWV